MMRPPSIGAHLMPPAEFAEFRRNFTDAVMSKKELERYAYRHKRFNAAGVMKHLDTDTGCVYLSDVIKSQFHRRPMDALGFMIRSFGSLRAAWLALDKHNNGRVTKSSFLSVLSQRGFPESDKSWDELCRGANVANALWITLREFDPEGFKAISILAYELLTAHLSLRAAWRECFSCARLSFEEFVIAVRDISQANAGILYAWLAADEGVTEHSFSEVMKHWNTGGIHAVQGLTKVQRGALAGLLQMDDALTVTTYAEEHRDPVEATKLTEKDALNAWHFFDWATTRSSAFRWDLILSQAHRGIRRELFDDLLSSLGYARSKEISRLLPEVVSTKDLLEFKKGVDEASRVPTAMDSKLRCLLLRHGGSLTAGFLNVFDSPVVGQQHFGRALAKIGYGVKCKSLWDEFKPAHGMLFLECVDDVGVTRQKKFVQTLHAHGVSASQAWQQVFNPRRAVSISRDAFLDACGIFNAEDGPKLWVDLCRVKGRLPWKDFAFLEFWERKTLLQDFGNFYIELSPAEYECLRHKRKAIETAKTRDSEISMATSVNTASHAQRVDSMTSVAVRPKSIPAPKTAQTSRTRVAKDHNAVKTGVTERTTSQSDKGDSGDRAQYVETLRQKHKSPGSGTADGFSSGKTKATAGLWATLQIPRTSEKMSMLRTLMDAQKKTGEKSPIG